MNDTKTKNINETKPLFSTKKTIILTKHFCKDRELKNKKLIKSGISQERKIKGIDKQVLSYIIQKNKTILEDDNKYLFIIEKNNKCDLKYYILFAYEKKQFIFISAMLSKTYNLKYKDILAKNMIEIKNLYLDDVIEKFNSITQNTPLAKKNLSTERKGIKKIEVNKPNEKFNKLKKILELIKSENFKSLSKKEQQNIILEKNKLVFYSNHDFIFDETFIEEFLKFEEKIYYFKIMYNLEKNITKEYILFLCELIENSFLDSEDYEPFLKKIKKRFLNYIKVLKFKISN